MGKELGLTADHDYSESSNGASADCLSCHCALCIPDSAPLEHRIRYQVQYLGKSEDCAGKMHLQLQNGLREGEKALGMGKAGLKVIL